MLQYFANSNWMTMTRQKHSNTKYNCIDPPYSEKTVYMRLEWRTNYN